MITVRDLIEKIDMIAPFDNQMEYDNSGLQIGSFDQNVSKLGITLDVNSDILKAAKESGINVIITHHPLLFRPIKALTDEDYRYEMIEYCVKNDIAVLSAHTNFDRCPLSNSVSLLKRLGLCEVEVYNEFECSAIGTYKTPISVEELRQKLDAQRFRFPYVLHLFSDKPFETVYCIAGAGGRDESAVLTAKRNADLFISSEFKHSNIEMARALKLNVIELSHYDSEILFAENMREYLLNYYESAFPIYILSDN